MRNMARRGSALILCLVIGCTFVAVSGVITSKAFFCRDPDTGKLHPLNSTWHSSSFCGKYTCKLRKKGENNPSTSPTPVENVKEKSNAKCSHSTEKSFEVISKGDRNKSIEDKGRNNDKNEQEKNIELTASTLDGDRYLTDEEITALAMILQYVKKSDLEAILDVYHLAQDIYKDLDKYDVNFSPNDLIEDENKTVTDETPTTPKKSYWYDPMTAAGSNKIKEAAEVIEIKPGQLPVVLPVPVVIKPTSSPNTYLQEKEEVLRNTPKTKMEQQEFFEGPLARNYLRLLPYYHPLTDFQKISSYGQPTEAITKIEIMGQPSILPPPGIYPNAAMYPSAYIQLHPLLPMYSNHLNEIHQTNPKQQQIQAEPQVIFYPKDQKGVQSENQHKHGKSCRKENEYKLTPWSVIPKKTDAIKVENRTSKTNNTNVNKDSLSISESKLMAAHDEDFPPVYLQNDTASSPYKGKDIWTMLKLDKDLQKPLTRGAYIGHIVPDDSSDAGGGTEVKEDVQNIEVSTEFHELLISNEMPAWQTAPLSASVLNEVKANMAKLKFLPYPFRKKITLERIEKKNKEEEKKRSRREVAINMDKLHDLYEAYIENSTCHTDTEPGFFRMGNASEPFPRCCPQRIESL